MVAIELCCEATISRELSKWLAQQEVVVLAMCLSIHTQYVTEFNIQIRAIELYPEKSVHWATNKGTKASLCPTSQWSKRTAAAVTTTTMAIMKTAIWQSVTARAAIHSLTWWLHPPSPLHAHHSHLIWSKNETENPEVAKSHKSAWAIHNQMCRNKTLTYTICDDENNKQCRIWQLWSDAWGRQYARQY